MGLVDTGAALTEEEVSAYQGELERHMAGADAAASEDVVALAPSSLSEAVAAVELATGSPATGVPPTGEPMEVIMIGDSSPDERRDAQEPLGGTLSSLPGDAQEAGEQVRREPSLTPGDAAGAGERLVGESSSVPGGAQGASE